MKVASAVGVLAVAAAAAVLYWQREQDVATVAEHRTIAPPKTAEAPQAPKLEAPKSPSYRPKVKLTGLLSQGTISSAFLEVDGAAARPFQVGDNVSQQWRLAALGSQFVVLSDGEEHLRVEMEMQAAAITVSPQAPRSAAAAEANPEMGKVPGGVIPMVPDDVARARNQEFIEFLRRRDGGG